MEGRPARPGGRLEQAPDLGISVDAYRALVESAGDPIVLANREGLITSFNPAAEGAFGYTAEEAVGQPLTLLMPERFQEKHRAGLARFLATGKARVLGSTVELSARRKDGREFPIELTLSTWTADGQIYFSGILRDVTERRRTAARLAQLAAMVEFAGDAIIGKTLDGIITAWNPAAERLYGYSAEEAIGRPVSMLIPEGAEDEFPALLERVARGEWVEHYDAVRRRKDGILVDVSATITPTPGPDGGVAGATVVARDITERKRDLDVLAATAAELERSNAELEQFSSIVAHDLSEPLRVVAGLAELLRDRYGDRLDEEGGRFLEAIENSTARGQRLIEDLLAYARVGREIERKPVDCREVALEALAGLARRREETGAHVTIDPLPTVDGDATQIGQLFQNLIGNALKFADRGPPEVHVSADREPGAWRFSVRDNGTAIDPKGAERIFEPFKRLHSESFEGTGIGLAICKRIVELHGGRIWVEPAPGGGNVFSFTIAA
jgi:PAS domain S-box-containing protein